MPFQVLPINQPGQMHEALAVRRRVFIEEQGVPPELEIDEYDALPAVGVQALHVLGRLDGNAVATGRLLLHHEDGFPHIGRVAVLPEQRGKGYGTALMQALHGLARESGLTSIRLAAQLHALGFYEKLGYRAHGSVFLDAGIEHRWMDLAL